MPLLDRHGAKAEIWTRSEGAAIDNLSHALVDWAVLPEALAQKTRDQRIGVIIPNTVRIPELKLLMRQLSLIAISFPSFGDGRGFSLARLISHAAKSRNLKAGAIIGSGTISNRDADGGPGRPVADGGRGYSCLAEIRMVETILNGKPSTPFMRFGDRVGIEMHDDDGASIFGRIDQIVENSNG